MSFIGGSTVYAIGVPKHSTVYITYMQCIQYVMCCCKHLLCMHIFVLLLYTPPRFSQSLAEAGREEEEEEGEGGLLTSSPKPRSSSFGSRLRKAVNRRHRHFSTGRRTSISESGSIPGELGHVLVQSVA